MLFTFSKELNRLPSVEKTDLFILYTGSSEINVAVDASPNNNAVFLSLISTIFEYRSDVTNIPTFIPLEDINECITLSPYTYPEHPNEISKQAVF